MIVNQIKDSGTIISGFPHQSGIAPVKIDLKVSAKADRIPAESHHARIP
jgi:hypothetical protein